MAHDEVVDRYSGLARAAMAGETVFDCGPDSFDEGSFGTVGYSDTAGLPGGALRASLGCGDPVAVAELRAGETVLDLGSGGGIDVLLSARRVGPYGKPYGLDASPDVSKPRPKGKPSRRREICGWATVNDGRWRNLPPS